jgi:hypothetical protein
MTNEIFWIYKKIIEMKIHKYKNIVHLIPILITHAIILQNYGGARSYECM